MAKVIYTVGTLSGKLGGFVFARNKGGAYVRSYTKPIDPATQAQKAARNYFGMSAGQFHALSDLQKSQWNIFGATQFIPKDGSSPVVMSGFNSMVSLSNQVINANAAKRTATFTAPTGLTVTFASFAFSQTPPANAMGSMIQDSTGAPLGIRLTGGTLNSTTAAVTFSMSLDSTQTHAPLFKDCNNTEACGFGVNISLPQTQLEQFVQKPRMQCVGIVGPPTVSTGWTTGTAITLSMAGADLNTSKFKYWPILGEIVEMSVYLISASGQARRLGTTMVTVA